MANKLDASITCIRDCIDPDKFDTLVQAVKVVAGFEEINTCYKKPSYARNIGYETDKMAATVHTAAFKEYGGEGENALVAKVKGLQALKRYDCSLQYLVRRNILWKNSTNKLLSNPWHQTYRNSPSTYSLMQNYTSNSQKRMLIQPHTGTEHLSLFKRRSGETGRLRLDQYEK
ncbi:hypothetical protein HOLleu_02933 [Holothuria leucospilota]|uniref:Uncharacterized protein n=1 Tax=Holothuria leucospilota TaxID=206669 RepID=A0A9Q1CSV6_HOLLE|nr:hypothetical protein HOLleu_02933 [Holothuria leucospilota]